MRKFIFFLILSILLGYTIFEQTKQSHVETKAQVETKATQQKQEALQAASFALKGLDNQTYEFRGSREKPLVLNFWASWCVPCQQEASDLKQFYETFRNQIDLYAINLTSEDKLQQVAAFVKKYHLTFPILLDEEGKVADSYRIQAIPTTFFIDKSGVVVHTVIGMVDPHTLEQYTKQLLGK